MGRTHKQAGDDEREEGRDEDGGLGSEEDHALLLPGVAQAVDGEAESAVELVGVFVLQAGDVLVVDGELALGNGGDDAGEVGVVANDLVEIGGRASLEMDGRANVERLDVRRDGFDLVERAAGGHQSLFVVKEIGGFLVEALLVDPVLGGGAGLAQARGEEGDLDGAGALVVADLDEALEALAAAADVPHRKESERRQDRDDKHNDHVANGQASGRRWQHVLDSKQKTRRLPLRGKKCWRSGRARTRLRTIRNSGRLSQAPSRSRGSWRW